MRILLLLLLLIQLPFAALAEEKPATITVHGEATTKVAPDQVTLPVTIREENISVKAAKEKNDSKLRALLKLASDCGIDKSDMKTSYTSITPVYDYINNQKPHLRGYQVETALNFTLDDIAKLGDFMNKVIGLGITDVGSVSYSLKDEDKTKEDTLVEALKKASDKASRLAAAAKMSLDKPVAIEEGEPVINRPIRPMPMMAMRAMAAPAESAPDLPAGMIEIRQSITVTYQLK